MKKDKRKVGLIGCGVVGGALAQVFESCGAEMLIYDKFKDGGIGELRDVLPAEAVFLCLPTLTDRQGKQDTQAIEETLTELALHEYAGPVVIKSTVLPGTCDYLQNRFRKLRIVHNPEFLTEAHAVRDFVSQREVLITGRSEDVDAVMDIYADLMHNVSFRTSNDTRTSELAKYIHNCFLAVKVAFMNEMYNYANEMNTFYDKAVSFAAGQGVIGDSHLKVPGPDGRFGFGGMCFPKDTEALINTPEGQRNLHILYTAVLSNRVQRSKNW